MVIDSWPRLRRISRVCFENDRKATRGKETLGQPFRIYYLLVPENTTLLDILNIAHWTHGLTTSLRQRKSSRLVNAAVENSPIRSSHSFALFFNHLFLPFHRLSLLGMAVGFFCFFFIFKKERNETCSQTFNEDISLPLMARKRISQRIIEEKKKKSCNRFLGFMFPNKGAGMSSLIKLVCVIMHSHYSLTEVSHLEKQCRRLQSSLPPFSSHFKPHRHSPRPKWAWRQKEHCVALHGSV